MPRGSNDPSGIQARFSESAQSLAANTQKNRRSPKSQIAELSHRKNTRHPANETRHGFGLAESQDRPA